MASTPEFNYTKNQKSSPFGSGISKRLLTPCRRVGLSRKWKSASKTSTEKEGTSKVTLTDSPVITPSRDINTSVCSKTENENKSTNKKSRKNIKEKLCRKKLEPTFPCNAQSEEDSQNITTNVDLREISLKPVEDFTNKQTQTIVVKAFVHNSDLESNTENINNDKDIKLDERERKTETNNHCKITGDCEVILRKLSEKEFNEKSIRLIESEESEEILRTKRKRRGNILSDDEDDFCIGFGSTNNSKVNNSNSKSRDNDLYKNLDNTPDTSSYNGKFLKIQRIELDEKPQSNKADLYKNKNVSPEYVANFEKNASVSLDYNKEQLNEKVDTSEKIIESEMIKSIIRLNKNVPDEHAKPDHSDKPKLSATIKPVVRKEQGSKGLDNLSDGKKMSINNKSKSIEKSASLEKRLSEKVINMNSVDEDAFTSTPEQDKSEKKYLIERIKSMERKVKDKRKKLQDLQQAAIYLKKHDVDELRKLREVWKHGCIMGLQGLLDQFRRQSPSMNMNDLLEKLNISVDIARNLSLELD